MKSIGFSVLFWSAKNGFCLIFSFSFLEVGIYRLATIYDAFSLSLSWIPFFIWCCFRNPNSLLILAASTIILLGSPELSWFFYFIFRRFWLLVSEPLLLLLISVISLLYILSADFYIFSKFILLFCFFKKSFINYFDLFY